MTSLAADGRTATADEITDLVAETWADVLEASRLDLDRDTNFFALGGNSLQAARIIGHLRELFGIRIPTALLFDAQSITGLGTAIAALRRRSPALLAGIRPAPRAAGDVHQFPTSFVQRGIWVDGRIRGDRANYNVPVAVGIEGLLDTEALGRAVTDLVERHEIFRTGFVSRDGTLLQEIHTEVATPYTVLDLRDTVADEREAIAAHEMRGEAARPFDLERPPLLRVLAVLIDDVTTAVVVTMHHLVTDGRSFELAMAELLDAYAARVVDHTPDLSPPAVQYADFASWEQAALNSTAINEQLDYWRRRFTALPGPSPLPTDRTEPTGRTMAGASVTRDLTRGVARGLRAVSRRYDATPFMTVVTALVALLHRYGGGDDVVVGTPSAHRDHPEVINMLGLFSTTLALRCDVSGDPTFAQLLARVRDVSLGAFAHQDIPYDQIVSEVAPTRSGDNPLFRVLFSFQDEIRIVPPKGLTMTVLDFETDTAKADLALIVTQTESGARVRAEYRTELFSDAAASRLLGHFITLLSGAIADPTMRVSQLSVLDETERAMLREWSGLDAARWSGSLTLPAMVAQQTARTPDAPAIEDGTQVLSYHELDAAIGAVAERVHQVIALDASSRPVCVCVEPGLPQVLAMLGVMRAGAAYLPLDPLAPADRLAFQIADADARLVLTTFNLAAELPLPAGVTTMVLDVEARALQIPDWSRPEEIAYVIYTSGSTGTPKGVMVAHGNVTPMLQWSCATLPLGPGDRAAQYLSTIFDWSVEEIMRPLASGACLVIVPRHARHDPAAGAALLRRAEVSSLSVTPTQLRTLLDADPTGTWPAMRRVWIGGEALHPELVWALAMRVPNGCEIWNGYGPTECSIVTTAGKVYGDQGVAPIGVRAGNATCLVLDAHGEIAPIGVPGELWHGGDAVTLGYLGRPALTSERFAPDPDVPGGRRYRTGDVVRWLPTGELEYLGRVDRQVKLRGVRIELGEIETALRAAPAVADSVVVLDIAGPSARLVAFVVPSDTPAEREKGLDLSQVRAAAARRLPAVMQPAEIVLLAKLPVAAGGKIDRDVLEQLAATVSSPEPTKATSPRTDTEREVARIWLEVVGVAAPSNDANVQVDVHANFFGAGGTSLSLLMLVERLREHIGVALPLRAVMDAPTIAGVAERLDTMLWSDRPERADAADREIGEL